jgi:hypothetical protein
LPDDVIEELTQHRGLTAGEEIVAASWFGQLEKLLSPDDLQRYKDLVAKAEAQKRRNAA